MSNLETKPPQDKPISPNPNGAARDYVRSQIDDLAWAIAVQSEILQRYCVLGDDRMIFHSVRQIRIVFDALFEITKRLHALKREGEA